MTRSAPASRRLLLAAILVAACEAAGPTTAPSPTSSTAGTAPIRLLIDTDMAADDIVAIASLLREPGVEVVGIAIAGTGEAHCPGGLHVARALVTALAAGPVPVACGREAALGPAQGFPEEWRTGADAGYGINLPAPAAPPDSRSAEQLTVDLASEGDVPLTILTLGPLTNLAGALRIDPALPARVERVLAMAGAIDVPGNVQPFDGGSEAPTAEWNLHADPTAAGEVFGAGFDLTLVPLDATNDIPLDEEFVAALESDHLAAPADVIFELYARNGHLVTGEPMLWDSLTAIVLLHPEVVELRERTLRIVAGDALDGGRTIEDSAGARVVAATSADAGLFRALLFTALRRGDARPDPFTATAVIRVVVGPTTCAAEFDPPAAVAGVVRLEGSAPADSEAQVVVFAFEGWTWEQVEAFAANPVFEDDTPVRDIATITMRAGGTANAYGDGPAGPIGVACVTGSFEAPVIRLAGPFALLEP